MKQISRCDCHTIRDITQEYDKDTLASIPGKLGDTLLKLRDKEKRRLKKQRYRKSRLATLKQKDSRRDRGLQTVEFNDKSSGGYLSLLGNTLSKLTMR